MTTTQFFALTIGDSTRGYTSAQLTKAANGKYRIVPDSINGFVYLARNAVRNLNRGDASVTTSGGDDLPVHVS